MMEIVAMSASLDEKCSEIKEQQAIVEFEIIDFQHAIEFYDLNAADGFCLYKGLQGALRKRRKLKNDVMKINVLRKTCLNNSEINNLLQEFPATNKYTYVPRVLTHLFEGR